MRPTQLKMLILLDNPIDVGCAYPYCTMFLRRLDVRSEHPSKYSASLKLCARRSPPDTSPDSHMIIICYHHTCSFCSPRKWRLEELQVGLCLGTCSDRSSQTAPRSACRARHSRPPPAPSQCGQRPALLLNEKALFVSFASLAAAVFASKSRILSAKPV